MIRRLPVAATLVVLVAVGIMIRLGFWQLDRMEEKEAMLARFAAAEAMSSAVRWPATPDQRDAALFRHSSVTCSKVLGISAMSGRNARGESGWAHVARCALDGGGEADVVLGWSREMRTASWTGGEAIGFVAPGREESARLVASPPLAGLEASAAPDPRDIPNNHFAYAVQWFLFAGVALVIYPLAVRKRLKA